MKLSYSCVGQWPIIEYIKIESAFVSIALSASRLCFSVEV
jgi:hypothetical protein